MITADALIERTRRDIAACGLEEWAEGRAPLIAAYLVETHGRHARQMAELLIRGVFFHALGWAIAARAREAGDLETAVQLEYDATRAMDAVAAELARLPDESRRRVQELLEGFTVDA